MMDRRRLLAALGSGVAGLSGCLGDVPGLTGEPTPSPTPSDQGRIAQHGYPADICEQSIIEDFAISAIVDPSFADDWDGYDVATKYRLGNEPREGGLADAVAVIGLTDGDRARAYPVPVVWWHEIVNDLFGAPLMVTFCSICNSGMVAERRVRGEPTTFGVSGQLWRPPDLYARAAVEENVSFGVRRWANGSLNNSTAANGSVSGNVTDVGEAVKVSGNLVMFDEATRSFWSQLLARAICGPMTGETLTQVPTRLTTWGEWTADHPDTDVLLPPPHSALM